MRTRILSFFVFLGLCFGTLFAYQQWHYQYIHQEYSDVLEMSENSTIQQINSPAGKSLVPTGTLLGTNEVDAVYLTYLINIEHNQTVEVILNDAIFNKNDSESHDIDMIDISYTVELFTENQAIVTVRVCLNMPETEQQYHAICGSQLSVILDFIRK